jgi:hypothetical protein
MEDGTAALTELAFASDLDSEVFRVGPDSTGIVTAGSSRFLIERIFDSLCRFARFGFFHGILLNFWRSFAEILVNLMNKADRSIYFLFIFWFFNLSTHHPFFRFPRGGVDGVVSST